MKLIALILYLSLSSFQNTTNLEDIYKTIKEVESNNVSTAIGDNGKAFGVVQIHKACVIDVNRYYGTDYKHTDSFDRTKAKDIFMKYINIGINRFKKKYCRSPTEQDIVRMWNGGIYQGYRKKSTKKYWARYLKFKYLT